ncbi:MAG: ribonuclease R [Flavobacteriales bacterium]
MARRTHKNSKQHSTRLLNIGRDIVSLFLKKPNQSLNFKQVAAGLGKKTHKEKNEIIKVLQKLRSQDRLEQVSKGKFKLAPLKDTLEGIIDFTSSGAAYVIIEGMDNDIYIPKGKTGNALNKDRVSVLLCKRRKNKTQEGEVIDVLKRNSSQFVGVLEYKLGADYGFVTTQSRDLHVDLYIPKSKMKGAKNGEKVIAVMTDWPSHARKPFGKITTVLGTPGEHDVEIHSILADYDLPYEFSKEVEQEANSILTSITQEEINKRRDMRNITTFTIDPTDAKDFDDALSFERLKNGNIEVGVHIADVSHYVKPGTLLDNEAYKRATSVYLVDRVVPMLPEVLSNNVCSLRPNEEKLTFSACFEMTEQGDIVKEWFGRTVILSDRRFTYEEAQKVIETKKGDFKDEILILDQLAKILREKRMQSGAISFDKIEVKFKLDENADPVGVYFKQSKDANKLIEEFMLLANRKVSEFVSLKKNKSLSGNTFVYRIHDDPDFEKLNSLKTFIQQFDYDLDLTNKKSISQSMNYLLEEVKGKGEANMIETLAMRTMSKAKYSTENIGHYGLTFNYYSHFTSPIRRYPDVIAHRLLQHYLDQKKSPNPEPYEVDCVHCSNRERLATDAERDSIKYMQAKYLEQHIGEVYSGVISGVTEWGIYVELPEILCEGMISLRDMKGDHYNLDPKNYQIIGKRTGNSYRLGDSITIKVVHVSLEKKQIDFEIAENIV